jgi:hypothetical protein
VALEANDRSRPMFGFLKKDIFGDELGIAPSSSNPPRDA